MSDNILTKLLLLFHDEMEGRGVYVEKRVVLDWRPRLLWKVKVGRVDFSNPFLVGKNMRNVFVAVLV